jgi:hypothetical protein
MAAPVRLATFDDITLCGLFFEKQKEVKERPPTPIRDAILCS